MRLSKKIRKPTPRRSGDAGENPLHPWTKSQIEMEAQCALATDQQLKDEWHIAERSTGLRDDSFAGFAMMNAISKERRNRKPCK